MTAQALMRALQAISGEIALDELPERLLSTALELAGCPRGVLLQILPGGERAVTTTGGDEVPPAVLDEVLRRQEPVVGSGHACFPLLGPNGLLGMLYLAGDTGPEVAAALKVFAGRASISLENAQLRERNTELRRRAELLRRSEELYRRAIAQAGAVPYVLDYGGAAAASGGEYTFIGEQIAKLTGYTAEEITPRLWRERIVQEFVPRGDQSGLSEPEALRRTRAGEFVRWGCDYRILTRDGRVRWLLDASVEVLDEHGRPTGSIGMLQDITERKRAEEERMRLAAILEATTDFVGLADPQGHALYLNRAGRRLVGIGEDEDISALSVADLHPGWAAARVLAEGVPTASREGAWVSESALFARGGRELPVSQVLLAHTDDAGAVRYFSTIARDITERRELEAQLRQAQKMEAVGRLAGGIAHDFNNLLTAIGGYSMLLLDRLGPDDPLREDIEEIAKAGELAAALTQQLLVFSRRQVLAPRVLDLNEVVTDVETLLRRLIRDDVTLVTRLTSQPLPVSADPGQLSQVIVNLVVNAEAAMPRGGRLTIETDAVELNGSSPHAPGPHALLSVSDTGVGMDDETKARIFEPFFTTKQRGQGTGLGLATVFGIVEQSGGHVSVSSEPGRGTTFRIHLPRVEPAPVERRPPVEAVQAPAGEESVLLVEDDEAVRRLARDVLRLRGYAVTEARDGEEAVRIAEGWAEPLDLLITDLVMPGISGRELAARLVSRWPGLRVLFISGYTDDAIFRYGALRPGHAFLQ